MHTHLYARTYIHRQNTHTHAYIHTHTQTHTHKHTNTQTHTHKHTYTHTHTHTPKCVAMLPTILHINFTLSSLSHEECYPSFHCCIQLPPASQCTHFESLNYVFEFRRQLPCICVLTHLHFAGEAIIRSIRHVCPLLDWGEGHAGR